MLSSIGVTLTLLASILFSVFSDNKSKLFDAVIRLDDGSLIFDELFLDDGSLIFDELFLGRLKGLVLLSSLRLIFSVLELGVFWIIFSFSSNAWIIQFLVLFYSRRCFILSLNLFGSHKDESVDFSFTIVLITNYCSIIKDFKAVISVVNTDIFSFREITLSSSIIVVVSATNFSFSLLMVFHSLLGAEMIYP